MTWLNLVESSHFYSNPFLNFTPLKMYSNSTDLTQFRCQVTFILILSLILPHWKCAVTPLTWFNLVESSHFYSNPFLYFPHWKMCSNSTDLTQFDSIVSNIWKTQLILNFSDSTKSLLQVCCNYSTFALGEWLQHAQISNYRAYACRLSMCVSRWAQKITCCLWNALMEAKNYSCSVTTQIPSCMLCKRDAFLH